VVRGTVVHEPALAALVRWYEAERRPPRPTHVATQWLVYFVLMLLCTMYMRRVSAKVGTLLRTQVALLGMALAFIVLSKAVLLATGLPALMVPVALVPLWTSLYVDRRTGSMIAVLISIFTASIVIYDPSISVVYLISACVAALSFKHATRKRNAFLIVSGALSGLLGAFVFVASKEIFDGFNMKHELALGLRAGTLASVAGGTLSGLLAFAFQPIASRVFGVVSRAQLLNLTDLEHPLLRKMATQAPGSWEHSRAMANLAEAASAAIGADALLTRVGAYYHDLGKTCQPKYFIENLMRGERSPHEDLEPDVSADAIMAHVVEGTRILRDGRVPEAVIEFSYTHHGTSIIEYFWHKCLAQGNPKQLTEEAFRYPGMRPRTRETAILMLIDSIEAGARTVDPPTREKFLEMVQRVVFVKMQQGQLDESGLTIADIRTLALHVTEALVNSYHKRVRYPWQDAVERGEAPLPIPTRPEPETHPPPPIVAAQAPVPTADPDTGKFKPLRDESAEIHDTGKFRREPPRDGSAIESGPRAAARLIPLHDEPPKDDH
ncbi:MAG TPA: HDIG domain-containing protein, partial [Polyangiales bacterium]|nr:HDIG domain-containing protein [Polyangiales bacterium]